MKKLFYLIIFCSLSSCNSCGIHGFFGQEVPSQGANVNGGCNMDVTANYKNNSGKSLLVYYLEINPNDVAKCDDMNYWGTLNPNSIFTIKVHKGKKMRIIFADDSSGQCSGSHQKEDVFVDCSKANSGVANFSVN